MKFHHVALACALALSACSEDAPLPPFEAIKQVGLGHVECVRQAALKLARTAGTIKELAQRAVASCAATRAKAIGMKAVPVMWESVAELDRESRDVATTTIEDSRVEAAGGPPALNKIRGARDKLLSTLGVAA